MSRWKRFNDRARQLDVERLSKMKPAERAAEAWRLFDELTAAYSEAERSAELARRRRDRVELLRRRRS